VNYREKCSESRLGRDCNTLKFHGSSFLVHPHDILARMSLTSHEESGGVGRVGRGFYEDDRDLSVTSRACRASGCREI